MIRQRRTPRYNIAPGQDVPVCRVSPAGRLECLDMRWGLVPRWSTEAHPRFSTINARAETITTKPTYRGPFQRQRCLIPADGWYEWQEIQERKKQPYWFHLSDDRLFFFAGIWDHWEGQQGAVAMTSCSIIVTEANETVRPIHGRMPVIITPEDYDAWLDPMNTETHRLKHLLRPYGKDDLHTYPVSRQVNNPRVDGPQCVLQVESTVKEVPAHLKKML